jgi:hypothetical protein
VYVLITQITANILLNRSWLEEVLEICKWKQTWLEEKYSISSTPSLVPVTQIVKQRLLPEIQQNNRTPHSKTVTNTTCLTSGTDENTLTLSISVKLIFVLEHLLIFMYIYTIQNAFLVTQLFWKIK